MDGWWNNGMNPDDGQEPANPFARVPAADHVQPQPFDPATQPVQPPEFLSGAQQPAQLFSQIRQGDPYGYAIPEAVPSPAFSGDMQNPFGSGIGAVPFGSEFSDPTGGSFFGFSAEMPSTPGLPTELPGGFSPPSYAGFPPLPASTAPMAPAEPGWPNISNTGPMPTLRWDPNVDPAQWQAPADPAALGAQTQRWQPGDPQPWEAPLTNVRTEQTSFLDDPSLAMPEFPDAVSEQDLTPEDLTTELDFLPKMTEKQKAELQADRLNIPKYMRHQPLPAKRPSKRRDPQNEAADPQPAPVTAQAAEESQPSAEADMESPAAAVHAADTETETVSPPSAAAEEELQPGQEELQPGAEEPSAAEPAEDTLLPEPIPETEPSRSETTPTEAQVQEAVNPHACFMRPAVEVSLAGGSAVADQEEPVPQEAPLRRRSRKERSGMLQPAALDTDALKKRRRHQPVPAEAPPAPEAPAPTTDEAGNSLPFVQAADADDSRDETLPARPQNEMVAPVAADATQTSAPEPVNPYGGWPSLSDPLFASDEDETYHRIFTQQPLYGDLIRRSGSKPAQEPLPTEEAIHTAATEDSAREAGPQPTCTNPYAAAFGDGEPFRASPKDIDADFLMDEDTAYEEPAPLSVPHRSRIAEPDAGDASAQDSSHLTDDPPDPPEDGGFVMETYPGWEDLSFPAGSVSPLIPAVDVPDFPTPSKTASVPSPQTGLPYGMVAETAADTPPSFDPSQLLLQGFPPKDETDGMSPGGETETLPEDDPLQELLPGFMPEDPPCATENADTGITFGTSSYDAGDMPNPTRGDMPYEAVSAFDTDSRRRAALLAAQAAYTPEPQPEPPPQNPPVILPKQTKPKKPPIKPYRVLLLVAAAVMVVFIAINGSRLITAYVQNTEEWAAFYNRFRADHGVDVNHAGETLQLRSDGSTFPPAANLALSPSITPPPGMITEQTGSLSDATGRTRQIRYPDNELRNILEEMQEIREDFPEVMGRLEIPGVLNEWVVQRNNTFYLNHNYRGTAEEGGAVFIDSACTLATPPENLHLRGSDNAPGKTFQPLWQYKTNGAAFVTEAATATVTTIYEKIDYLLVSVFEASMDPTRPDYFNYSSYPTFASDAEMMDYIAKVRQRSLYALPTDILPGDRLLTLSTVSNAPGTDEKPVCLVLIFRHRPATAY